MDKTTYTVTGSVIDGKTVALDQIVPVSGTKVKVTIEPLEPSGTRPLAEVMADIYQRQAARGHVAPLAQEVDRFLNQERDTWT